VSVAIRDRIKEFRRVPAAELIRNEKNWREHPPAQRHALQKMLETVGYADAAIAYESGGDLVLIDGHLRADMTPDMEVPVLILDVNDEEADLLLATIDPMGQMAAAEAEALSQLIAEVSTDADDELRRVLGGIEQDYVAGEKKDEEEEDDPEPKEQGSSSQQKKTGEYVIITFRMARSEYEEHVAEIQQAVEIIGVTPHIEEV
jgi:hypothetical protein